MGEANPFLDLPGESNPFLALPVGGAAQSGPLAADNPFASLPSLRVPFSGLPEGDAPPTPRPQEEDQRSGLARVGDAALEAVKDLFSVPLGMSDESLGPLVARTPEENRGVMGLVKTFNRVAIQGGSQGLDLAGRVFAAPFMAGIAATGQVAQELGASETEARKLVRDLDALFMSAVIVTGNGATRRCTDSTQTR